MTADRIRRLVTPEGVDLRLRLAEAGTRAGAFLFDLIIMLAILTAVTIALLFVAASTAISDRIEVVVVVWILFFFLLRSFYFTAFEMGPRAATPGKRMLGLRVAGRDGRPLGPASVLARNAMREVELFVPMGFVFAQPDSGIEAWIRLVGLAWSAVFVLFPLFNPDRLRPGDLLGGTWVIEAPKRRLLSDLAMRERGEDGFTTAQLDAYGIKELQVLEDVIRAGDEDAVAAVAARIRAKIGREARPDETDAQFLDAYYAGLRERLEGRLLFGQRKADKHG